MPDPTFLGWVVIIAISAALTLLGFAILKGQLNEWLVAVCAMVLCAAALAMLYEYFVEQQRDFGRLLKAPTAAGFYLPYTAPGALLAALIIFAIRAWRRHSGRRED